MYRRLNTRKSADLTIAVRFAIHALLCVALALATTPHSHAQAAQAHLFVRVQVPPGEKGQLAYLVFAGANGFPGDKAKAVRQGFVAQDELRKEIDLGALPPGRYAVSLYMDRNGNGKLDSGWFGIPKEPVGVSRNPHPRMGPPHYNECAFEMTGGDLTLDIRLVKPS